MRVLIWSDSFWPHVGGVEVLGANFVSGMRGRGHEVMVITDRDDPGLADRTELHGAEIVRVDVRKAIERRDLRSLARVRARVAAVRGSFGPDLDHVFHAGPELMVGAAVRARQPLPLVFSLHLTPSAELLDSESSYGRELRAADWVTACSRATLAEVQEQTGPLERASVVANALPPPSLAGPSPPPEEPVLLFLGRLSRQKGFDLGLEALARLRESRPRLRAIVAGDGAELSPLREQARALSMEEVVEFTGWVAPSDVPALIARSTVVMMPSRFEPYGLVAVEAAQNGRPLVGFAVDGLVEAVAAGAGTLVAAGDVGALAAAAAALLDDPERADRMGEAGRAAALSPSPWQRHIDQYEELFGRLIAS